MGRLINELMLGVCACLTVLCASGGWCRRVGHLFGIFLFLGGGLLFSKSAPLGYGGVTCMDED